VNIKYILHTALLPSLLSQQYQYCNKKLFSRDSEVIILGGRSGTTVVKYVNILNIQTGKIKEIKMQWKEKLTAFFIMK
jgi:hypothetical protein